MNHCFKLKANDLKNVLISHAFSFFLYFLASLFRCLISLYKDSPISSLSSLSLYTHNSQSTFHNSKLTYYTLVGNYINTMMTTFFFKLFVNKHFSNYKFTSIKKEGWLIVNQNWNKIFKFLLNKKVSSMSCSLSPREKLKLEFSLRLIYNRNFVSPCFLFR